MEENKLNNILNYFIDFENSDYEPQKSYIDLYNKYDSKISRYFTYFHQNLNELLKYMNERVSNGHYTANESRELIDIIEKIKELKSLLQNTKYSFSIDERYNEHINFCYNFLSSSYGSDIPKDYKKILIKRYEPIFIIDNNELHINTNNNMYKNIKFILKGEGAYAKVFSFDEPMTKRKFAIKKLNKEIEGKEKERFKLEFEKMNSMSNPYILKAYSFNDDNNSYIMEYCNYTLNKYISKNNNKDFLNFSFRKNIALQFLKGLSYLHSKNILHRDISLNNIMINEYDDNFIVIKISDFGLVKDLNLDLTRTDSEIRGTIIDDTLTSFKDYNIKNEIYSIGVVLWFIFTGKTNLKTDLSDIGKIVNKCVLRDHTKRFSNVKEIIDQMLLAKDENTIKESENETIKIEKIQNKNRLNINDKSFTILKAMIENKSGNQLFYLKTLNGEEIQTNNENFKIQFNLLSPREKASWKSALESLVSNKLITPLSYKNEIFEVTENGYKLYDLQKDDFVVQVI